MEMSYSMPSDQDWDEFDLHLGSESEHDEEENDILGDLKSFEHPRPPPALQSGSAMTDASLGIPKPSPSTGGISASTGTFVSAKTNQSAASKLNVASYGTSYFSTSPFSQALSKEVPVRSKSRSRDLQRGPMSLGSTSDYMRILEQNGLLPSVEAELNWSGRKPGTGQHVEFEPYDAIPLQSEGLIFCSATARIDKVKCKRIFLARKSMTCHKKMRLADAMNEVKHLNKLRHSHIVQLVGSYIQSKTFAVLLYPVADLDLKDFLQQLERVLVPRRTMDYGDFMAVASLGQFFKCLAAALAYVHSQTTKHLDIKPRNVLVKRSRDNLFGYQVYLADFGISRSFSSMDHSQTETYVGRTAKYCAPEVYADEPHGRAADIFSMGCVFLEIQTVICRRSIEDLDEVLEFTPPTLTFHANLSHVFEWIRKLANDRAVFVAPSEEDLQQEVFAKYPFEGVAEDGRRGSMARRHASLCTLIHIMMHEDPTSRPTASGIVRLLDKNDCCDKGREPFRSEPVVPFGPIDSSTELNRLFKRNHQTSTAEREDILCHIVESGNNQLTESFLRYFSAHRLEPSDRSKRQIFQAAFLNSDFDLLKMLFTRLQDETLLHAVLSENTAYLDLQKLEQLVHTFTIETRTSYEIEKLLLEAVEARRIDLVQCLLQHGFDSSHKDFYGKKALYLAVKAGSEEFVDLLLRHNGRLERAIDEQALLSQAVLQEHHELAIYLLARGADPRISLFGQQQPGRTVLHDVASLASPGKDNLLHLARLLIMKCDCREKVALPQGTPADMVPVPSDGHVKLLVEPWLDLLKSPVGARLNDEDTERLDVGIMRAGKVYLNSFADRWETYKTILSSSQKIKRIVCLDIGAVSERGISEANFAHLFIIRDLLQRFARNKRPDVSIFLENRPGIFNAKALNLDPDDPQVLHRQSLTQFSDIDRESLIISLDPKFAARQALADLLPSSKVYPVAIICERVYMLAHSYPALETFNDPISRKVQAFFSHYTAHDLTSPDLEPGFEAIFALSSLTLYLRPDIRIDESW
jgi:serine/threonine protein kinase